jgi:hypothetical protein
MPSPLPAAGSAYSASSFLRIFLAKGSLISVCLGTALNDSVLGVHPERMASSFSLEKATSDAKATLQIPALHPTEIFS